MRTLITARRDMMKRYLIVSVLFIFIMTHYASVSLASAEKTVDTTITVDESALVKTTACITGVNDDAGLYLSVRHAAGRDSACVSPEYIAAVEQNQLRTPLRRLICDYNWKEMVGPLSERGFAVENKASNDQSGRRFNFGIVEWIQTALKTDPGVQFAITSYYYDTPENIADLVRFLTLNPDDPQAVGSDGVNWPAKRIEYGIREPVRILCLEIGNEEDASYVSNETVFENFMEDYIAHTKQVSMAVKAVNPDIKIAPHAFTYDGQDYADMANAWNTAVIGQTAEYIDYVAYHYYYSYRSDFASAFRASLKRVTDPIQVANEKYGTDIKVYLSEHAVWIDPDSPIYTNENGYDYGYKMIQCLYGTLTSAEFLVRLMNNPDCGPISYHAAIATPGDADYWPGSGWGVIRPYNSGEIVFMGMADLLSMFSEAYTQEIVSTTVSKTDPLDTENIYWNADRVIDRYGVVEDPSQYVLTAATYRRSDGGLNLILVNRNSEVAHNLTFQASGQYYLEKEVVLTGETMLTHNDIDTPDAFYAKESQVNADTPFTSYTIDAKSVVVLYLSPDPQFQDSNLNIKATDRGNGLFDIDVTLYQNRPLAGTEMITAILTEKGADFSDSARWVYMNAMQVTRDGCHFNLQLPAGYENKAFTLTIGASGIYDQIEICGSGRPENQEAQYLHAAADGTSSVTASMIMDKSVAMGSKLAAFIVYGTYDHMEYADLEHMDVVYMGEVEKESDAMQTVTMQMAGELLPGTYTLAVFGTGNTAAVAGFAINGRQDGVAVTGRPYNAEQVPVDKENITQAGQLMIPLENYGEVAEVTAFLGVYDETWRLLFAGSDTAVIETGQKAELTIPLDEADFGQADRITLFIWDQKTLAPYTMYYNIR